MGAKGMTGELPLEESKSFSSSELDGEALRDCLGSCLILKSAGDMLDDLEADDDGDEVQDLKLDSSQDDSSELLSDDDNIESIPKVREDG